MLDTFKGDAFKTVSLTDSIRTLPYKPNRLGAMGLFAERGIVTNTAVVENLDGVLSLVPTKKRGEPGTLHKRGGRTARSFLVPHIPLDDEILASDISGVREFGTEDQLQSMVSIVNDRLTDMRQSMEATIEFHRVGAINGVILDADGTTVIFDLFAEFGLTQVSEDFLFGTATEDIKGHCLTVKRAVEDALGNSPYDHIHGFCSPAFYDALTSHATVTEAFKRSSLNDFNINDSRSGFPIGGIIWEEYRGQIGDVPFIADGDGIVIPVGVPNLFTISYAPGEFIEAVNTVGLNLYAKQMPMEFDRGIKLHVESNPLAMCNRPLSCVNVTSST